MTISFDKQSKEEKKAEKLQREELEREAARETANTVMPLFIEKAKKKLVFAVVICVVVAILNEFILKLGSDSSMVMIYAVIGIITYAATRKEWKAAKYEAEMRQ